SVHSRTLSLSFSAGRVTNRTVASSVEVESMGRSVAKADSESHSTAPYVKLRMYSGWASSE
ncbi:MAG: hypothetical protein J4N63_06475, partial [Chloroflexi bacterium]|nr:hypothetical protein [Chloroflexota bacterium]